MKRWTTSALVALVLVMGLGAATPTHARPVKVRLDKPTMVDQHTVLLTGKVRGRARVVIQRYVSKGHRWVRVKAVKANSRGLFRTTVRTTRKGRTFRAAAGRAVSRAYFTRATSSEEPPDDPEQPQEPEEPEEPPTPSDACGPQPAKADGSLWSCTLAEDFDGVQLDRSLWTPQTLFTAGSPSGRPCYVDDPEVIEVVDGALRLRVKAVDAPLLCLGALPRLATAHIAGGVMTYHKFSQQYGRFEARIKTTSTRVPGLQESFWLWPDDRYPNELLLWPAAGEIDIAETYSLYPDLAVPFLHYTWNDNGGPWPGLNTAWSCVAHRGEFNTYTLEWDADRLEILVNGRSCLVNTSGDRAFDRPYIIALTAAMGAEKNAYDGRAPLPAEMVVDYVRVWQ